MGIMPSGRRGDSHLENYPDISPFGGNSSKKVVYQQKAAGLTMDLIQGHKKQISLKQFNEMKIGS